MNSLYIHMPFCLKKCFYCDFYSREYDENIALRYLNALKKELGFYRESLNELRTVYIGGGTPSVLNKDYLDRLLAVVTENIQLKDGYEFTIEVNPVTLTHEKIDIFKNCSINRVSIGVQSFNVEMLSTLGRLHNIQQADDAVRLVSSNFENFSIDLIYGIPGQDDTIWGETLRRVSSYKPLHISSYELTPEEGTPLFSDIAAGRMKMLDEDSILRMYETAARILSVNGYHHYEISNYARPGYESIHNLNYWRRGEYIGIGPSAHTFLDGKRFKNVSDVKVYCEKLECSVAPFKEIIELSPADEIKEIIMLGLRTKEGINMIKTIAMANNITNEKYEIDSVLNILKAFIDQGLIDFDDINLKVTEKGFALSNSIIVEVMRAIGL